MRKSNFDSLKNKKKEIITLQKKKDLQAKWNKMNKMMESTK